MAGCILKLTVDRQNKVLVAFNGTPATLPDQFQSNTVSLQIQVVDPTGAQPAGSPSSQYSVANMAGFGMRAAVGDTPEGISGPTPLALQDTLIWDSVNQWFAADLALNTTAIDTFLGTSPSKSAYFELNLTINGTRITIFQNTFNLRAVVDELNSNVPTPTDKYLTATETNAQFMPRIGANGDVLTLKSPDGTHIVEIGIDNNGQLTTKTL